VYPTGLGIDLGNVLGDSSYLKTSNKNISYFFHPCTNTKVLEDLTTNGTNPCNFDDQGYSVSVLFFIYILVRLLYNHIGSSYVCMTLQLSASNC
jgi:hypothetical protein